MLNKIIPDGIDLTGNISECIRFEEEIEVQGVIFVIPSDAYCSCFSPVPLGVSSDCISGPPGGGESSVAPRQCQRRFVSQLS